MLLVNREVGGIGIQLLRGYTSIGYECCRVGDTN